MSRLSSLQVKVLTLVGLIAIGVAIGASMALVQGRRIDAPAAQHPTGWLFLSLDEGCRVMASISGLVLVPRGGSGNLQMADWQGTLRPLPVPEGGRLVALDRDLYAVVDETGVKGHSWPGGPVEQLELHTNGPALVAVHHDGVLFVATVNSEGTIITALRKDRMTWTRDLGRVIPLRLVVLSASGDAVLATLRLADEGPCYEVHLLDTRGNVRWSSVTGGPASRISVSTDGRIVAVAAGSQVHVFGRDGSLWSADCSPGRVVAVAVMDDGALAALVGDGQESRVLFFDRKGIVQSSLQRDGQAGDIGWHPAHGFVVLTGDGVAAIDNNGNIRWSADLPAPIRELASAGVTLAGAYVLSERQLWILPIGPSPEGGDR